MNFNKWFRAGSNSKVPAQPQSIPSYHSDPEDDKPTWDPALPNPRTLMSLDARVNDHKRRSHTLVNQPIYQPTSMQMAGDISNYECALDHIGMRWQGRLFVTDTCVCFIGMGLLQRDTSLGSLTYLAMSHVSNEWRPSPTGGRRIAFKIKFREITRISRELTMGVWPNALAVVTSRRRSYIFTNLDNRDQVHRELLDIWQHPPKLPKPMVYSPPTTPPKRPFSIRLRGEWSRQTVLWSIGLTVFYFIVCMVF